MLVRVRSNVGTWKLQLQATQTLQDVLKGADFEAWKVTKPLSWDPSGKRPLSTSQSLQQQGIQHGSMIYCRLEEHGSTEEMTPAKSENNAVDLAQSPVSKAEKKPKPTKEVIDLVASDADEKSINLLASSSDEESSPQKPKSTTRKKRPASPSRTTAKKPKATTIQPTAEKATSANTTPNKFQIASYNVWFGPPDPTVNQVYPQQRMQAIANELDKCRSSNSPLQFIGFQELTASLTQYLQPHIQRIGYKMCTQPLGDFYGVGLGVSKDLEIVETKFVPFGDSTQRRGLLFVQTPTLLFGTTHLESFVDAKQYNGVSQRESQIVEATRYCQDRMQQYPNLQVAMISGDFNWDDERKRGTGPNQPLMSLLSKGWHDAGQPFDYTYDGKENPMLGGNLRRRFDRCIYYAPKSKCKVQLQTIGREAIPNLTWNKKNPYNGTSRPVPVAPSDHFGIVVSFETKS